MRRRLVTVGQISGHFVMQPSRSRAVFAPWPWFRATGSRVDRLARFVDLRVAIAATKGDPGMNQRPQPNFDFARAYTAAPTPDPGLATAFSDDKEPDQPAHLMGEELDEDPEIDPETDEPVRWTEDVDALAQRIESWR
jgi:hypothetical protein